MGPRAHFEIWRRPEPGDHRRRVCRGRFSHVPCSGIWRPAEWSLQQCEGSHPHFSRDELDLTLSQVIAASPYSYAIYDYGDPVPTSLYHEFAGLAGCGQNSSRLQQYPSVFQCLVETESEVLQYASGNVSESFGIYGSWAFLPVIDRDYIQERPSVQLTKGLVAGRRILVGVSLHMSLCLPPLTCCFVLTSSHLRVF